MERRCTVIGPPRTEGGRENVLGLGQEAQDNGRKGRSSKIANRMTDWQKKINVPG